jgi:hypothetical protein
MGRIESVNQWVIESIEGRSRGRSPEAMKK